MGYLARREHTNLELTRKLEHAGYAEDEIETILNEFSQRGWLSDQRFAEDFVNQKKSRFGILKLEYELRQHGVEETDIQRALELAQETELERALDIWRKKYDNLPANTSEKARQIRFLQGRGFSMNIILLVLIRAKSLET
jgi:regulatory protein